MKLNKIYAHKNHRFPDKRIFYPTKITRYTVDNWTPQTRSLNYLLLLYLKRAKCKNSSARAHLLWWEKDALFGVAEG